jgi:hypothetical protein
MSNYVKPWPFGIRRLSSRDIYVLLLFFMILLIPPRSPLLFLPDYVLFRNMWRLEAYCCRARELTIRLSPRRLQRSETTKLRDSLHASIQTILCYVTLLREPFGMHAGCLEVGCCGHL